MKSFLYAATLLTTGLAAVLDVPPNAQWMNIISRSDADGLNNVFLSARNGRVGIYNDDKYEPSKAAKIFSTSYEPSSTLSLHIQDDSHQVALVGANGLLNLVDVVNPTADSIPKGQAMEWSTFVIDGQGQVNIKDGADIPTRRWVAVDNGDGSHAVALYDGVTLPVPEKMANITLIAVAAQ